MSITETDLYKVQRLAAVAREHIKSETSEEKHAVVDDLIDILEKIVLNLLSK